jgi:hypothetical protein
MKPQTKISSKLTTAGVLFIALAFISLSACQEGNDIEPIASRGPLPASFTAGPEGGSFKALDGNVQLFIPENALTKNIAFHIEEGSEDEEGDFVIQSILIEPKYLEFNAPIGISLRYDGCLCNGKDPCKAKCLALYYFEDDKAFDARRPKDMVWIEKCCLNTMDRCIETKIRRGGVYAIGEASMDQTDH